jgi:putative nucleotidyltransferase with HDIG domain
MPNSQDVTSSLASIPPFPRIALDVMESLQQESRTAERIVELVERDVAMTTAVLKLANSGLYGRRQRIGSVRAAFQVLGQETFSQAVLRVAMKQFADNAMPASDLNRCWAHSIACSEIARCLSLDVGLPPDIALSAGLLHDIGRFGLAIAAPEQHHKLLNTTTYVDLIDLERELFGIDHTEAGRLLAEQFGFPDEFRVVAGRHHDPASGDEPDLLAVVTTACRLANAIGFQVVASPRPISVEEVIARAPAILRDRIAPDADLWRATLLQTLAA